MEGEISQVRSAANRDLDDSMRACHVINERNSFLTIFFVEPFVTLKSSNKELLKPSLFFLTHPRIVFQNIELEH